MLICKVMLRSTVRHSDEVPQTSHPHRSRQLRGFLVDRPKGGMGIDEDRKKRNQECNQDLRFDAKSKPQQ
jgi:hypothetical protein